MQPSDGMATRSTISAEGTILHAFNSNQPHGWQQMFRKGAVMLAACIGLSLSGCGGGGSTPAPAALPTLTVTNASVVEGNAGISNLVFTVTSNIAATSAITVNYATADGTALAGSDYTATNGTLTIPVGATSGTVTVPVSGDTVIEVDETFTLAITAPSNATITGGAITGTIINDDTLASIASASIAEGSTGGVTNLVFTVTLSVSIPSAVTLNYATADGTALSASDYTAGNATLTIPAGSTSGTITVLVGADTLFEPNETFTLTLSGPTNATLGTAVATGTILNDDAGGLNDTGITKWGNATANNLTVTQPLFPVQDADVGRDANPAFNSNADGKAGFSFTKLDAAGQPLANQAATYATTPWNCVLDNITGLMWEVKQPAGSGGLRDTNWNYSWYNSAAVTPGTANGGRCVDTVSCDTEKYIGMVNAAGLCGFTDWRLPNIGDLISITDYSVSSNAIDTGYFPNSNSFYWSSSVFDNFGQIWSVDFTGIFIPSGSAVPNVGSSSMLHVRLVRGGL